MTPNAGISWNRQKDCLRPLWVNIEARVVDDIASLTATQTFWNHTKDNISEAIYTFPLPNGCSVTDFSCQFGWKNSNKLLTAKVQPREQARTNFNRAQKEKTSAALGELNTPEIFSTSLGNIPSKARLKVEVSFVCILQRQISEADDIALVTLTIPTTIAPRYGTPPPEMKHTNITQPLGTTIEVTVISRDPSLELRARCKGHQVTQQKHWEINGVGNWEEAGTLIKLVTADALGGDFVLKMSRPIAREIPSAWVEYHPEWPGQRAMMISIPPIPVADAQGRSEILFLADRSGSMEDKIGALKKAMAFFLHGIPQGRLFNIWSFGSKYSAMWHSSREHNNENLREAEQYVSAKFKANMGGTELLPALRAMVNARDPTALLDVVVLTDGEYWALDETTNYVRDTRLATNGAVRFFALGIGSQVSHALVENIARAGGGYSQVVEATGTGALTGSLVAMLDAALKEHASSVDIHFDGSNRCQDPHYLQAPTLLKSPFDTSGMSPFVHNRLMLLFNTDEWGHSPPRWIQIIRTDSYGKEQITRIEPQFLLSYGTLVHKLAARALLGDLERGESWIQGHPLAPARYSREEEALTAAEGEALGIRWNLASKWTSFFIEESSNPRLDDPFLQDRTTQPSKGSSAPKRDGGSQTGSTGHKSGPGSGGSKRKGADSNLPEEAPLETPGLRTHSSTTPPNHPQIAVPQSQHDTGVRAGKQSAGHREEGAGKDSSGTKKHDLDLETRTMDVGTEDAFAPQSSPSHSAGVDPQYGRSSRDTTGSWHPYTPRPLWIEEYSDGDSAGPQRYEPAESPVEEYHTPYPVFAEQPSHLVSEEPIVPVATDLAIEAPSSIPVSNTVMLKTEKTDASKARKPDPKQKVVTSLIELQTSEGFFKLADKKAGKKLLGRKFATMVDALSDHVDFRLASTVAIIVLLRHDYRKYKAISRLSLAKAVQYVLRAFPECNVADEGYSVDDFLLDIEGPVEESLYHASGVDGDKTEGEEDEDELEDDRGERLQRDLATRLQTLAARHLAPGEEISRKTLASLNVKVSEIEVLLTGVSSSWRRRRSRPTGGVSSAPVVATYGSSQTLESAPVELRAAEVGPVECVPVEIESSDYYTLVAGGAGEERGQSQREYRRAFPLERGGNEDYGAGPSEYAHYQPFRPRDI